MNNNTKHWLDESWLDCFISGKSLPAFHLHVASQHWWQVPTSYRGQGCAVHWNNLRENTKYCFLFLKHQLFVAEKDKKEKCRPYLRTHRFFPSVITGIFGSGNLQPLAVCDDLVMVAIWRRKGEPSAATRQWDQGGRWRISDRAWSRRFLSFGVKMCYKWALHIRKTWTDVTKQLPLLEGWRCRQLERLLDMFSPSAGLWAARPAFTNDLAMRFYCEPLCDVFHTLCLAAWHRSCAPNLFRTRCKC